MVQGGDRVMSVIWRLRKRCFGAPHLQADLRPWIADRLRG